MPSVQRGRAALIVAILLLCLWRPALAQAQPDTASLQAAVDCARVQMGAPAALVAVGFPDGRLVQIASGLAQLEPRREAGPGDPIPVGSVTKLFTATLVLQLVSEGKLSLEQPLADFYPQFPNANRITLRMLLEHRSGLANYTDLGFKLPPAVILLILAQQWEPERLAAECAQLEPLCEPGAEFHYSNTNYILLGLIIERVTGHTYTEELHARIIDPLGLQDTCFAAAETPPANTLHGYALVDGALRDRTLIENPSLGWAAGALVTTTADLDTFLRALFGGKLLPAELQAQMLAGTERGDGYGRYGLGVMQVDTELGPLWGHEGITLAYRGGAWYLPQRGITVIALTNLFDARVFPLYEAVAQWAVSQPAGPGV
jgi:D-alanyl-D-alanine carboxypeptidase